MFSIRTTLRCSRRIALAALALVALGGSDTCGTSINKDPGFDLWCGNRLCAWTLEYGHIQRVPTWHRSDFGVSFIGDKVSLWQDIDTSASSTSCFRVTLQADTDADAELELSFDFFNDGSVEYSHPMVSDNYETVTYLLTAPTYYQGLRLRVIKRGGGRAIVTRLRLDTSGECKSPPITTVSRPLGARCEGHEQCTSDRCISTLQWVDEQGPQWQKTCSQCADNSDCEGAAVCGQLKGTTRDRRWHRGCVAPSSAGLGERCASGAECISGSCCQGICSTCCEDNPGGEVARCAKDERCEQRPLTCGGHEGCQAWVKASGSAPLEAHLTAWTCSPGTGKRKSGEPCQNHDDCELGRCLGEAASQCLLTGEPCTEDKGCLMLVCLPAGVSKGRCG